MGMGIEMLSFSEYKFRSKTSGAGVFNSRDSFDNDVRQNGVEQTSDVEQKNGMEQKNCAEQKEKLRSTYRKKRQTFFETKIGASPISGMSPTSGVLNHLSSIISQRSGLWAIYNSVGSEVDLKKLPAFCDHASQDHASHDHVKWAYPRVCNQGLNNQGLNNQELRFFSPPNHKLENFTKGSFGILEPNPEVSTEVLLADITAMVIPGVAFDRKGGRLGQGQGFYDRALKNFKGLKVGVAYSVQISDKPLPMNQQDVYMDLLVTETEVLSF